MTAAKFEPLIFRLNREQARKMKERRDLKKRLNREHAGR
jgi:hypothetical protein